MIATGGFLAALECIKLCLYASPRNVPIPDFVDATHRVCGAGSTIVCPFVRSSVCLSHRTTAAGGFAAERRRLQQTSVDICERRAAGAGAQQQMRVASR